MRMHCESGVSVMDEILRKPVGESRQVFLPGNNTAYDCMMYLKPIFDIISDVLK